LSPEEITFLEETRDFMERVVAPRAEEIDREDQVPEDVFAALQPYLSLTIPSEYGGQGKGEMYDCLAVQEIGYVCPALVPYLEVAQLFAKAIEIAGTEAQKKRYLGKLASGTVGAYALTDAGPGSDPAAMITTAEPIEGGYRIRGKKRHITFFDMAEIMVLFAKTSDEPGPRSISGFVVEKPWDGIQVQRRSEWTGLRGHKAWDLNVDVESDQMVGAPGEGLKVALQVLNFTRTSLACGHVGLADAALDLAIRFSEERKIGGKPLWRNQSISFSIVEAAARVEGARLLGYRAVRMAEKRVDHRSETAMAKFAAAEALIEAVTVCNRILGGYGGHLDYPGERYLRDAFSWVAAQGTLEIQKLTAARGLFK